MRDKKKNHHPVAMVFSFPVFLFVSAGIHIFPKQKMSAASGAIKNLAGKEGRQCGKVSANQPPPSHILEALHLLAAGFCRRPPESIVTVPAMQAPAG